LKCLYVFTNSTLVFIFKDGITNNSTEEKKRTSDNVL